MRFKRNLLVGLVIAAAHFAVGNLILPLTASLTTQAAVNPEGPGAAVTLLVRATKLLHFPLVTLALYPREWFPGNWIYVPMALNSAVWAAAISGLIVLFRERR